MNLGRYTDYLSQKCELFFLIFETELYIMKITIRGLWFIDSQIYISILL